MKTEMEKDKNSDELEDGGSELKVSKFKSFFPFSPIWIGVLAIGITFVVGVVGFNKYQKQVMAEKKHWEEKAKSNQLPTDFNKKKWAKALFNQRINYLTRINNVVFEYALSLNLTEDEKKEMGIPEELNPKVFQEAQAEYLKMKEEYKSFVPSTEGLTKEGMAFYLLQDEQAKDVIEHGFAFWDYFFKKAENKENMKVILLGMPQNSSDKNFLNSCEMMKKVVPEFDVNRMGCPGNN